MAFDLKMEVYTPTLELVGMLNEWKSVIWEEKAFTAGSFSLDSIISAETRELLVKENIIWITGESAGIIEHIEQQADDTGPYITVKGRMLTGILDRRILWGLYNLSGTPAAIMHRLVDDCAINPTRPASGNTEARKIHGLVSRETPSGGPSIQVQMTGDTLLERLETLGRTYGVAFGVAFNAAVPRMEFWTRYGVDRSVNQTDNDPVFYSTELDDVLASEYTYDSSQYRNVALVAGEGEGDDRKMIVVEEDMPATPLPPKPPEPEEPDEPVTKYTITATVDPSGSGKVTGAGTYNEGATVNLTATSNEGYDFTDWKEGGETVHDNPEYSFTAESNRDLVAAFAEQKTSRLPDGYTEVEYIQSSGSEYINTNLKPSENLKIEMDVEPKIATSSTNRFFFNSQYSSNNRWYAIRIAWTSNGVSAAMCSNATSVSYSVLSSDKTQRRMKLMLDEQTMTASADGESKTFTSRPTTANMSYIYLLSSGFSTENAISAKLYSCQMYDGETATRDFVPCTNPDGQAGLYDLVSEEFYSSAGSGSFTAGPPV